MPEKSRVPGCGKSCVRCWRNKLKYGNKLKKKKFSKAKYVVYVRKRMESFRRRIE